MRKHIRSFAMVTGCCACLMACPSGRSQGFYLNTDVGVSLADKVDVKTFLGPTPGAELDFDTGVRFGVAGGYNVNDYIGAELETGYIYNSFKDNDLDATLSHIPLMVNVVFRYDRPNCKWVPYGGAGAGGDVSIFSVSDLETTDGAGDPVIVDGADATFVFAWQAFAGVRYKFNDKMSIGAGYKYYSANNASWDVEGAGSDQIEIGRATSHSFLVEFNIKF